MLGNWAAWKTEARSHSLRSTVRCHPSISQLSARFSALGRASQPELVLFDPADGAVRPDEEVAATGADGAGWFARGQPRDGLGFGGGREAQGGVFLQHRSEEHTS